MTLKARFPNHKDLQNMLWTHSQKNQTWPQVSISFPHSCLENRNSFGECLTLGKLRAAPIKQRVGRKQLSKKTSELVTDPAEIKQLAPPWITANLTRILYRHCTPPEKQTDETLDSIYAWLWRRQTWEYLVIPKIPLGRAAWPSSMSTENLDFRPNSQANHYCFYFKSKTNSPSSCFWSSSPQQEQDFVQKPSGTNV